MKACATIVLRLRIVSRGLAPTQHLDVSFSYHFPSPFEIFQLRGSLKVTAPRFLCLSRIRLTIGIDCAMRLAARMLTMKPSKWSYNSIGAQLIVEPFAKPVPPDHPPAIA